MQFTDTALLTRIVLLIAQLFAFCPVAIAQPISDARINEASPLEMLPGVVEPVEFVTLATPFDGLLQLVSVSAGDTVQENEIVAVMDDRVAQAAVRVATVSAQNRSELELTERQLAAARREASRFREAHQRNAASGMDFDRAQAAAEQAEVQRSRAQEQLEYLEAQLALARARLDEHYVRAPFTGRVLSVEARAGQSLNRAEAIVTIANLSLLQVDLQVPVDLFGTLAVGTSHVLYADKPINATVSARLVYAEPRVDAATQTFRCRFEIPNPEERLPSGFAVRLSIPRQSPEASTSAMDRQTRSLSQSIVDAKAK